MHRTLDPDVLLQDSDAEQLVPQVKPELALALYGVRRQLPDSPLLRRCFHAIVSMFQAAHNCDYYITKYQGKSMEQLQNLFAQIACGLRRLQLEEASATEPSNSKTLARKTLLRIAMAANRSSWCSCCELAIYIKTGALCRKTHAPVQVFLSRPSFLLHQCGRLLQRSHEQPIEAPDGTGDLPLSLNFLNLNLLNAPVACSRLSFFLAVLNNLLLMLPVLNSLPGVLSNSSPKNSSENMQLAAAVLHSLFNVVYVLLFKVVSFVSISLGESIVNLFKEM